MRAMREKRFEEQQRASAPRAPSEEQKARTAPKRAKKKKT
jgi:hypothetical protein